MKNLLLAASFFLLAACGGSKDSDPSPVVQPVAQKELVLGAVTVNSLASSTDPDGSRVDIRVAVYSADGATQLKLSGEAHANAVLPDRTWLGGSYRSKTPFRVAILGNDGRQLGFVLVEPGKLAENRTPTIINGATSVSLEVWYQ